MEAGLRINQGGSGEPVLLLLHGLGATGDVWDGWRPWLARRWPGRWLAPDLPGHGGSRPLSSYTFDTLAAAVVPEPSDHELRCPFVFHLEHRPLVLQVLQVRGFGHHPVEA